MEQCIRKDVIRFALEFMETYYTSQTQRRLAVVPELAIQTHCALELQRTGRSVLTEVCWESAVFSLNAASAQADLALPARGRIDMIALSPDESCLAAFEFKRDASIHGLRRDLDRMSQLFAAWSDRKFMGSLIVSYSFTHSDALQMAISIFESEFKSHDPIISDPTCFKDPLNNDIGVHCAVASCLAIMSK